MYDISEFEKEYIITQLTFKNMAEDLMMLFVTEHISFDDIFHNQLSSSTSFYNKVFKYMCKYIQNYIDKGKISELCKSVFTRIDCFDDYKNVKNGALINSSYYGYNVVKFSLDYLLLKGNFINLNMVINSLSINEAFNFKIIVDILLKNEELSHYNVLSNLIETDVLDIHSILLLLAYKAINVDMVDIKSLILTLFRNKRLLLDFMQEVMNMYEIRTYNKNEKKVLDIRYIGPTRIKNEIELIKEFLSDIIYTDAEIDFYDFIHISRKNAITNSEQDVVNLYASYCRWFDSESRRLNSTANMLFFEIEDIDSELGLCSRDRVEFDKDLRRRQYWSDLDMYDGYDLFIKLFNLNRFKLLNFRRDAFLDEKIANRYEEDPELVDMALSNTVYFFIKI